MSPELNSTPTTITSEKTNGRTYTVQTGITEDHIHELITLTQNIDDVGIARNTSDWKNGAGRFASRENFDKWLEKGRSVYTLVDDKGKLSGIAWFGAEDLPTEGNTFVDGFDPTHYGNTIAIRLYGEARGKGLAVPYSREALARFKSTTEYNSSPKKGIWLETNSDNDPTIATYTRFGCRKVSETTRNGRILMVFPD